MEKRDNGAEWGEGNAWGNIFDAYSLVAADTEKNIRYNIGGRREGGAARVETSEKSSEANDRSNSLFFLFFVHDRVVLLPRIPPPQEEIDDKFYIQGGIVYVYARVTKKQYFTYYASFFQFFLQAYTLFESLYILFKYDSITGVKFEK